MQYQDEPMLFDDIKPGMWVIVIYKEKFLAKVQHKSTNAPTQLINVLCSEKPLAINTPQSFEKSSFDAEKVTWQKSDHIKHKLTRMEKRHKSGYRNVEIHFIDISFVKSH